MVGAAGSSWSGALKRTSLAAGPLLLLPAAGVTAPGSCNTGVLVQILYYLVRIIILANISSKKSSCKRWHRSSEYYGNVIWWAVALRVRRGINSSASACCYVRQARVRFSARHPRGGPLLSGRDEDNKKRFSTSYIYCMSARLMKNKRKEWTLATKPFNISSYSIIRYRTVS
jgi:hypothetical protein